MLSYHLLKTVKKEWKIHNMRHVLSKLQNFWNNFCCIFFYELSVRERESNFYFKKLIHDILVSEFIT